MKKLLSIILSLLILMPILPINARAAGTMISFSSNDISVNEILSVIVTIDAGEAMYGVGCAVSYDNQVLEYMSGASAGGGGRLQIIESPSGLSKVTYFLQFKAISEGNAIISISDCRYESLTESKGLSGASVNITVRDTAIAEGTCKQGAIWQLSEDGILIIKGSGATDDYKLPQLEPWYDYREQIKSVIIEEDVTRLGNNSFSGLENLEYAKIYNSDLDFGVYVFGKSSALTIGCYRNSTAEEYAKTNGYNVYILEVLDAPVIESIKNGTATLVINEGYEYSMDGINWQSSNIFSNIPKDEIMYFYQRTSGSDINENFSLSNAAKGIYISAPEVLVGSSCIRVKQTEGYEYGLEDLIWQESNEFNEYIVNGETYTVYRRPINREHIFVGYEGIAVTVNGENRIEMPDATDLVWLRNLILNGDVTNNLAADCNGDCEIDARDIVNMKKSLGNHFL